MENCPMLSTLTAGCPAMTAARPMTGRPSRFTARPRTLIVGVGLGVGVGDGEGDGAGGGSSGGPPQAERAMERTTATKDFEANIGMLQVKSRRAPEQGACRWDVP